MSVPRFDIFYGAIDRNAMWIEAVEGLGAACERMKEHASENPGQYFVFNMETHKVLVSIDTSRPDDQELLALA